MSKTLIQQAKTAGRTVIEQNGRTTIKFGRWDGVVISEAGSINRFGMDLTCTKNMSVTEARRVLKLA